MFEWMLFGAYCFGVLILLVIQGFMMREERYVTVGKLGGATLFAVAWPGLLFAVIAYYFQGWLLKKMEDLYVFLGIEDLLSYEVWEIENETKR